METKLSILIPAYNAEETIEKTLASIPRRNDTEIIIYDDGSTDRTVEIVERVMERIHMPMTLIKGAQNCGVSHAVNMLLGVAMGEWIVLLGSDDWFIPDAFSTAVDALKETLDLVYFNLETNNGTIFRLTNESKVFYCGSTKFMRRAFIGDTRLNEAKKAGEDYYFFLELLEKKPREAFTNLTVKHYNYPRKGSLSDRRKNGEFTADEL